MSLEDRDNLMAKVASEVALEAHQKKLGSGNCRSMVVWLWSEEWNERI